MFNRSQIMTRAWQILRRRLSLYKRAFNAKDIGEALRTAWAEAKRAEMSAAEIRVEAIRYELATLSTRSFQQNIEPLRRRLETELASIAA
jgi:hypothetical protein